MKRSMETLIQEFKDDLLTLDQLLEAAQEILLKNKDELSKYFYVLIEESTSYAYRKGYSDACKNSEYSFDTFKEEYLVGLHGRITEILDGLVNNKI